MAASKSVRFGKKQRNFQGKINQHKLIYIEVITRWRQDMNFIFEWQNNILRISAASE